MPVLPPSLSLLLALLALGGVLYHLKRWLSDHGRPRNEAQRYPLTAALRPLVASDLSWMHCAWYPQFYADALPHFHFLVEDEGFSCPHTDPDFPLLRYRRGDVGVHLTERRNTGGPQLVFEVVVFRSASSTLVLERQVFRSRDDGLGDGARGTAFFLRQHLDRIVTDLRRAALHRTTPAAA